MTREELRVYVDKQRSLDNIPYHVYSELIDGIDELEQELCEDTVSRQAVLSMQYRIDDSATLSTRDVVNVEDIEDLPSVTPKEKKGYWIFKKDKIGRTFAVCSECDHLQYAGELNYCPYCGAEMIKVDESD